MMHYVPAPAPPTPTDDTSEKEHLAAKQRHKAGVRWMSLYGMYVGDSNWSPYPALEFGIAFVVTVLEGAVSGSVSICFAKCLVSLILIAIQLAVLVIKRPLGARFDQVTTTVAMSLSLLSGTLMTVGLITSNSIPEVTIAASFVMIAASLVVTVQGILGMVAVGISATLTLKQILYFIKLRIERNRRRRAAAVGVDVGGNDDGFEAGFYDGTALALPLVQNNSGSSNGSLLGSFAEALRNSFGSRPTPQREVQLPPDWDWKEFLDELEMEEMKNPPPAKRAPNVNKKTNDAVAHLHLSVSSSDEEMDDLRLLLDKHEHEDPDRIPPKPPPQ